MTSINKLYKDSDEKELKRLFTIINANTLEYKNNQTIAYSMRNRNMIGIIEEGSANLVRFDYNGSRTIIEELNNGDVFSDMFLSSNNSELVAIATSNCKVTFIEYDQLTKKIKTNNTAAILMDNLFKLLSDKLINKNERIELLTARSIRNKLLSYFELQEKKYNSKSFNLNLTYTDLADYLAVDRSAMMRELKNLKDEGFIKDVNKKITILY